MKKLCILGLASLFLLVGCGNSNQAKRETYYDKENKVFRIIDYTYNGDKLATMSNTTSFGTHETGYTYDQSGNLVREYTRFISDGKYFDYSYASYTYDNHNKLIGSTSYTYDTDINAYVLDGVTNFAYDDKGNLITFASIQSFGIVASQPFAFKTVHEYNDQNSVVLTEEYTFNFDKSEFVLFSKDIYTYKEDGVTLLKDSFYDGENLSMVYDYVYNDKNLCTEVNVVKFYGVIEPKAEDFKKITNEYDDKGNLVSEKEIYYNDFLDNNVTRYEYDSSSRLTKKTYYNLVDNTEVLDQYVVYTY